MEVIAETKRGISGSDLRQIQREAGFSNEEWARYLHIADRTVQRYERANALVDPVISERALLLAQLAEYGREVFGSDEKFKLWLGTASFALGGVSPKDILDTSTGLELIRSELTRIEHGTF